MHPERAQLGKSFGRLHPQSSKPAKAGTSSPALANVDNKVSDALDPINTQVNKLTGDNGDLEKAVSGVVSKLNPLLNLAGANANVSASLSNQGSRTAGAPGD